MKSLEDILREFPPRWASQITGLEAEAWYFLLSDGGIIGGRAQTNHRKILGLGRTNYDPDASIKEFCSEHNVIRICFSDEDEGHLYIEIHKAEPNEAQWSTLGSLYGRRRGTTVVWDVWFEGNPSHGEGSLTDFKRLLGSLEGRQP